MKKVYFIRHGESEGNAGKIFQTENSELSQRGIEQAKIIANRVTNLNFDMLISSTYIRAKQTAKIISEKTNKEIVGSDLFVERANPSEILNESRNSELSIKSLENYTKAFLDDSKYKDAESFKELVNRAKAALDFLDKQEVENIVVITHGMFLRVICAYVLLKENLNPKSCFEMMMTFKTANTGITMMEKDKANQWRLNVWNDHAHFAEY